MRRIVGACDFVQTYDVFFRAVIVLVIIELESRQVIHFNGPDHLPRPGSPSSYLKPLPVVNTPSI